MTHPMGLLQWSQTGVNLSPAVEPVPQDRVGPVERWDCPCPKLWAHHCRHFLGVSARERRSDREQLRDWYRDGAYKSGTKRGDKRRSLEVSTYFAPVLRWVVAWSDPTCRHLGLAMDASTLGPRFTVLLISVVVRGCAIPVSWRMVEATCPGAWRSHWEALFGYLQGSVPAD